MRVTPLTNTRDCVGRQAPTEESPLLDDRGALAAVDRKGLRITGMHTRRRLDDAQGAVLEADARHRRVLYLDALVGQRGGEAADVRRRPHHPQEQIDVV